MRYRAGDWQVVLSIFLARIYITPSAKAQQPSTNGPANSPSAFSGAIEPQQNSEDLLMRLRSVPSATPSSTLITAM
jgi:hypothetical protein